MPSHRLVRSRSGTGREARMTRRGTNVDYRSCPPEGAVDPQCKPRVLPPRTRIPTADPLIPRRALRGRGRYALHPRSGTVDPDRHGVIRSDVLVSSCTCVRVPAGTRHERAVAARAVSSDDRSLSGTPAAGPGHASRPQGTTVALGAELELQAECRGSVRRQAMSAATGIARSSGGTASAASSSAHRAPSTTAATKRTVRPTSRSSPQQVKH